MNVRLLFFVFLYLNILNLSVNAQLILRDSSSNKAPTKTLFKKDAALNFIAMGDWGRNGADHQKPVAAQLGKTAAEVKAQFIISTGDNFYPSGVISEQDPLFKYSFEDIYTAFSLQWDWYVVLGNHDYKSNPDAQVAYSKISRRWKMPARYFAKKFPINGDLNNQVLIAFIDTNPLIPEFYKNTEYGPNVKRQDTTAQKRWLNKTLSDTDPSIKWKIVVGHHPIYTGGSRTEAYDTKAVRSSLKPTFDKYGVDVYLTGHEHSLQYIKPAGKTHYFISGAASEKTPVKLIPDAQMVASEYGFMLFSITKEQLLVQTINEEGYIIYSTLIKK
ncbi:purple acid phosphatase family protein [Pedobacter mendelii]|uniref:acid phosphatase n=1 Tax=Pedobacter mendelii TaxID=1908240 RepID=A0ABQ2BGH7_9SPHI|nr:tartrate-resistant acid phosphatase type 5 family protein [Pedobacter mendelii]GGI24407.1 acid phosphatase [Pedobacter mendelii]